MKKKKKFHRDNLRKEENAPLGSRPTKSPVGIVRSLKFDSPAQKLHKEKGGVKTTKKAARRHKPLIISFTAQRK